MPSLLVKEVFRSIQGEGPAIGEPATFIRISGCNLACSYCDTGHDDGKEWGLTGLVSEAETGPARVVITGGEPLLAGENLIPLARAIVATGRKVDIETNGTIAPPAGLVDLIDNYVISPKLSNSGNRARARALADPLPAGPLKFIVDRVEDLDEVEQVAGGLPGREVIITPMGTNPMRILDIMSELSGPVAGRGWRLLPRLHILLGIR